MQIDVTGVDLKEFIKNVYDLSRPQGMGYLHFRPGPLSDEEAENIVRVYAEANDTHRGVVVNLDYVLGRSCKMVVFRDEDKWVINAPWYDHSDDQLRELLKRHNITFDGEPGEHGAASAWLTCP